MSTRWTVSVVKHQASGRVWAEPGHSFTVTGEGAMESIVFMALHLAFKERAGLEVRKENGVWGES